MMAYMAFLTSKLKLEFHFHFIPLFLSDKKRRRFDCLCYQYVQVQYSSEAKLKTIYIFLSQNLNARLVKMGALDVPKVVHGRQGWRLITCMWLHAGVVHLLINMLCLVIIGIRLEQEFGFGK